MPRRPFKGKINVDVRGSVPDWEPYTHHPPSCRARTCCRSRSNLSDDQYIDLEQEAMAALARE